MAIEAATKLGMESEEATVSNTNEIQQVVESLIGKVDAIYAPTDNVIAKAMPTVSQVANANNLPVICGEEGMVDACGLATYGIDYYELGKLTGKRGSKNYWKEQLLLQKCLLNIFQQINVSYPLMRMLQHN